jgi:cytochrome c553
MSAIRIGLALAMGMMASGALAQDADVSIAKGERVSIIGGCHDCHTVGYGESNGEIDPATALMGNPVGYNGPWGTSYAVNLRLVVAGMSEDEWVQYLKTFKATPPMPWFNVHHLDEGEMRSLYQYIASLGEPGKPAPEALPPGEKPKTPYLVFAPPTMPSG